MKEVICLSGNPGCMRWRMLFLVDGDQEDDDGIYLRQLCDHQGVAILTRCIQVVITSVQVVLLLHQVQDKKSTFTVLPFWVQLSASSPLRVLSRQNLPLLCLHARPYATYLHCLDGFS